jgi:hypothetical protein
MADQHEQEREKTSVEPTTATATASDVHLQKGEESSKGAQPPRLYIPACGVLCDAFWWAGSKTK